METEREHNNTIVGRKDVLRGGGAGCSCILMMPGGIIAVGLTSGDSTGIGARSGGAGGTAPMVLTRQRQCHPGPAGIGWRGKAPWGAVSKTQVLLYLVYSRISGKGQY